MFQRLKKALASINPGYLTVAGVLFATVLLFAVASYFKPAPSAMRPAELTKTADTAVQTVNKAAHREATQDAKIKEAVDAINKTSSASDDMGDTGRAGLDALCGLRAYAEEKSCAGGVFQPDTGRVEKGGNPGTATEGKR